MTKKPKEDAVSAKVPSYNFLFPLRCGCGEKKSSVWYGRGQGAVLRADAAHPPIPCPREITHGLTTRHDTPYPDQLPHRYGSAQKSRISGSIFDRAEVWLELAFLIGREEYVL